MAHKTKEEYAAFIKKQQEQWDAKCRVEAQMERLKMSPAQVIRAAIWQFKKEGAQALADDLVGRLHDIAWGGPADIDTWVMEAAIRYNKEQQND